MLYMQRELEFGKCLALRREKNKVEKALKHPWHKDTSNIFSLTEEILKHGRTWIEYMQLTNFANRFHAQLIFFLNLFVAPTFSLHIGIHSY